MGFRRNDFVNGRIAHSVGSLAEEWNYQFFEANPSRECDEKPEHGEEHNCRTSVWLLGKWWQEREMCFLFGNTISICSSSATLRL